MGGLSVREGGVSLVRPFAKPSDAILSTWGSTLWMRDSALAGGFSENTVDDDILELVSTFAEVELANKIVAFILCGAFATR